VRAVLAGEQVLSAEIRELSDGPAAGLAANPTLSERERQVLSLVAQGATNKQIATDLVISVRTVEAHIGNAMAKLQARSRAEAITRAIQRGTIVPDEPL
jgi:DNA-binding NarL/FixJ family response regulator